MCRCTWVAVLATYLSPSSVPAFSESSLAFPVPAVTPATAESNFDSGSPPALAPASVDDAALAATDEEDGEPAPVTADALLAAVEVEELAGVAAAAAADGSTEGSSTAGGGCTPAGAATVAAADDAVEEVEEEDGTGGCEMSCEEEVTGEEVADGDELIIDGSPPIDTEPAVSDDDDWGAPALGSDEALALEAASEGDRTLGTVDVVMMPSLLAPTVSVMSEDGTTTGELVCEATAVCCCCCCLYCACCCCC
uniref:Putative translation initiation factor if-2 n=1 Tax=Anopheles triannulatus TaxID=58253 RepID=A0A2M4ATL1_9DIPT